jgi:outer membrane protein
MLVAEAVEEINKDGKYKLIINSTALLDGAPELDITGDLLKIVNEKYAAEKAAAKAE